MDVLLFVNSSRGACGFVPRVNPRRLTLFPFRTCHQYPPSRPSVSEVNRKLASAEDSYDWTETLLSEVTQMTEPSPVGEYFKELFLYKPPLVLPAKPEERPFESAFFNPRSDETDSPCGSPETTLLARFYNLHLSEDVVLKHVRHSSVLIKNIEKRAEKGIHLLEDQDPPGVCLEAMPLRFMHTATDNLERISRSAFDVNIFMSATIRPFFPYFVLPLSFRLTDYDRVWKAPLVGLSSCDAPHDMALSLREPEGSTVWDELEELLSAEPESRELLKDMIAANRTTLVTCKIKGPEMVPALVEIIQKTAQGDYEQFPRTVRSQPDVDLGPQGPVQPENGRKKSKDSSVASELVGEPIQGPRAKPIPDSCQNDVNTILQKIESKPDPNAAERILQQVSPFPLLNLYAHANMVPV